MTSCILKKRKGWIFIFKKIARKFRRIRLQFIFRNCESTKIDGVNDEYTFAAAFLKHDHRVQLSARKLHFRKQTSRFLAAAESFPIRNRVWKLITMPETGPVTKSSHALFNRHGSV